MNQSESPQIRYEKKSRYMRYGEYLIAIILNLLAYYIVYMLPAWDIAFLSQSFYQILPLIKLGITIALLVNFAFIFYDANWFKALLKTVLNVFALIVLYNLFIVFPFDLDMFNISYLQLGLKVALGALFIILFVISIINFFALFFAPEE